MADELDLGPRETRTDDEQRRLDRQLGELLNELRVAMPGVQILFGFLLTVPFQQRFQDTDAFQHTIYFVTLLACAVAAALFIAPSAYHRIMFQRGQRPAVIQLGTREFLIGLVALAIAMNGAVLLVTDLIFQGTTVVVTAVGLALLFGWLWFGLGLARRLRAR